MRNIFLIVAIALVHSSAMAHNPLTAKFELNAALQEGAILNIYLSQTGLHQALIKYYEQTDFATISANEYKKLAVQYLKKHIAITADTELLKIGEGGIKLGSHQTDLKFLIENYPSEVNDLEVNISAFNGNENHHSVFWWKRKDAKTKIILSAKNDFRGALKSTGQTAMGAAVSNRNDLWLGLGVSVLFIVLFVFFQKKSTLPKGFQIPVVQRGILNQKN